MIGITGASGKLGKATLDFLSTKIALSNVVAMVREPEKVLEYEKLGLKIRRADYNDSVSLHDALRGVKKLLQISTTSVGEEGKVQEANVVDAAKKNSVQHIVYTSSIAPNSGAYFLGTIQAFQTESFLLKSGIDYTFFRNSLYMEAIPEMMGDAIETGKMYYPAGEHKINFVSRRDIAEALANVLVEDRHENRAYSITGPRPHSFHEITELVGKVRGRQIKYEPITLEAYCSILQANRLPSDVIDLLTSLAEGIQNEEFNYQDNTLEKLLKRPCQSLEDFLRSL